MKHLKLLLIIPILFALLGCISTKMYFKVYRDGNSKVTTTFQSENAYAIAILIQSLTENDSYTIIDKGQDEKGRYYITCQSYNQLSSDVFSLLESNEKTKNISVNSKSGMNGGLFSRTYIFDSSFGSKDESVDEEYSWIYESMPVTMTFEMPGSIVTTTGKKIADNKVVFNFTMYDLMTKKTRVYVKSEENEVAKIFNANQRMQSKIEDNYSKIDKMNEKIKFLQEGVDHQQEVNENIAGYAEKSMVLVADTANMIVEYYHQVNNDYPANMEDVKLFAKNMIGIDIVDSDRLIYDPNTHLVTLLNK